MRARRRSVSAKTDTIAGTRYPHSLRPAKNLGMILRRTEHKVTERLGSTLQRRPRGIASHQSARHRGDGSHGGERDTLQATQTPAPTRVFATATHVAAGPRSNRGVGRPARQLHQQRWYEQRLSLELETRDPDGQAGLFVVRRRSGRSSHPSAAGVIGIAALPPIGRTRA